MYYDKSDDGAMDALDELETMRRVEDDEEDYYSPEKLWERLSQGEKNNCTKWFSKEEVIQFVNNNFGEPPLISEPAKQRMVEIDEAIKEIWELDPKTLAYFYSFPDEWEENGLAQMIRDKFGVPEGKYVAPVNPVIIPEKPLYTEHCDDIEESLPLK